MKPHGSHSAGKNDGMFLCDAYIEITVRHFFFQKFQTCAGGHGCSDPNQSAIFLAEFDQFFAKDILPGRWAALSFDGNTGFDVVRSDTVQFFRMIDGCFISFALGS